MNKIKSFEELKKAVNELKPSLILRENFSKDNLVKRDILVCGGTGCSSSDSLKIIENLKDEIEKAGLSNQVEVQLTGCFGFCAKGPIVKVYPDNVFYIQVKPEDAHEIIQSHIINNDLEEKEKLEKDENVSPQEVKQLVKKQEEQADLFAAEQVGKNKMLNALDYLIREKKSEKAKPKDIKELENRRKIISKLED